MGADIRSYVLDISVDLFQLSTEGLRLHSNETLKYETLESLVDLRATASSYKEEHKPDTLRKHLCAVPTSGDIRVFLNIRDTSAKSLNEARASLSQKLGSDMTVGDALSVLLFDYVAEKKAAQLIDRLGLRDSDQNECNSEDGGSCAGNVTPIR